MNLIPSFIRSKINHRPNLVKILENITWLFFDKFLRMGIGLLVGVWVARYLGPDQFGLLSFAAAFAGLFSVFAMLGLQGPVVRDLVQTPDVKYEILGTAGALQMFGGFISYLMMLMLFIYIRPDDTVALKIVAILGSVNLIKFIEIAGFWFESQVKSKYVVWAQNVAFLIFAIIKLWLIYTESSLINFAWAILGEAVLAMFTLALLFSLYGARATSLVFSLKRAKNVIRDCWPLILSSVAVMLYMRIDQIMLGQMVGSDQVGIYSAAVRISEVWNFIPLVITASIFPAIVEVKIEDEKKYYARFQKTLDFMVLISLSIAIPISYFSNEIIELLYGDLYKSAGLILSISIWASVFIFIGLASSQWFLINNLPLLTLKRSLLGAIVNIALNLYLIPSFGATGAAISTVISFSIAYFLSDLFQRETRVIFFMKLKALNLFSLIYRNC